MNITDVMKNEMAMLENALENAIGANLPPLASRFVFNSPMYTQYLTKVEDVLLSFMDPETGMIDGKQAHQMLSQMYPTITKWVSIPQKHFKIGDEINEISKSLIGKEVL